MMIRHIRHEILKRETTIEGLPGGKALESAVSIAVSARSRLGPCRREGSEEKNIVADSKHWNMEVIWIMLVPIKSGVFSK